MPKYALGDVCSVTRGAVITEKETSPGDVPVVAGGLRPTYYHGEANRGPEVITVSASGANAGHVSWWDCPIWASDCSTVQPHPGSDVDSRFMFWQLKALEPFIKDSLRRGAAQPHVYAKDLAELRVVVPPADEQRRIVAVLDAADGLRTKRREALDKLDTLTQAIFIEMFGPVGLSGEMMTLGDALADADVFTDGDWVESKDQDPLGEVRLTQLADIGVGIWLDKSERYMNRATADRLRCTFLEPGDVLVARMPDPIGRACIFPGDRRPSVTAVDVCIIRPSPESVDARWLVEALNLPRTRAQIERRATGSTRSRISRRNLAKVEVALPPLDAQREFTYRAAQVERSRGSQLGSMEQLDNLFSSLQQRAFRGEL